MSNIYIQEPPTNGKVLLVTSMGDIDIELWSKETPRACRNFIQLCMEGYYDDTIFHRAIKGFIVQGGDPTGTGLGGDSIYGKPFKDEFHSRLRFNRRGLVAMANSGVHDNSSQFFFTFAATPELNGKHTLFAKVVGNTLYNMLKLENVETGPEDRPIFPPKIIKTQILLNPFDDVVPREIKKPLPEDAPDSILGSQSKATKNFSLLSFGSDAEEEEEETLKLNKDIKGKSKSSHDLSNDPNLSSVPALDDDVLAEDGEVNSPTLTPPIVAAVPKEAVDDSTQPETQLTKSEELNKEAKRLKREIHQSKKVAKLAVSEAVTEVPEPVEIADDSDMIGQYKVMRHKYKNRKKEIKSKDDRESQTLAILHKFQTKLAAIKAVSEGVEDQEEKELGEDEEFDMSWFNHKLDFSLDTSSTSVIDANVYDTDRYDVHDPRNPLNKRKREAAADSQKPGVTASR